MSPEELRQQIAEVLAQNAYGDAPGFRDDESMYPLVTATDEILALPAIRRALAIKRAVDAWTDMERHPKAEEAWQDGYAAGNNTAMRVLRAVGGEQ